MTDYSLIRTTYVQRRDDATILYVCRFLSRNPPPESGDYLTLSDARFVPPLSTHVAACLEDAVWGRLQAEDFAVASRPPPDMEMASPLDAFDLPLHTHRRDFPEGSGQFGIGVFRQMIGDHARNEACNHAYALSQDQDLINQGRWKTGLISAAALIGNGLCHFPVLPGWSGWAAAGLSIVAVAALWYVNDRTTHKRNVAAAKFKVNSREEAMKLRQKHDSFLASLDIVARDVRLLSRDQKSEEWIAGRAVHWPERLRRAVRLEVHLEDLRRSLPDLMGYHRRRIGLFYNGLKAEREYRRTHIDSFLTRRPSRWGVVAGMAFALTAVAAEGALRLTGAETQVATAAALAVMLGVGVYAMGRVWHWMTSLSPAYDPQPALDQLSGVAAPAEMDDAMSHALRREAIGQLMAATLPVSRMP